MPHCQPWLAHQAATAPGPSLPPPLVASPRQGRLTSGSGKGHPPTPPLRQGREGMQPAGVQPVSDWLLTSDGPASGSHPGCPGPLSVKPTSRPTPPCPRWPVLFLPCKSPGPQPASASTCLWGCSPVPAVPGGVQLERDRRFRRGVCSGAAQGPHGLGKMPLRASHASTSKFNF